MKLVQLVHDECAFLRQNPLVFPDAETFQSFFAAVNRYTEQIQKTILLWKGHHQRHEEIGKEMLEKKLQSARPRYSPELTTQPWQQFLCKEAPAWPVALQMGPDIMRMQAVPNGGVRLIEKWENEMKAIYAELDNVHLCCAIIIRGNIINILYNRDDRDHPDSNR
jgi:hypothetical protein